MKFAVKALTIGGALYLFYKLLDFLDWVTSPDLPSSTN